MSFVICSTPFFGCNNQVPVIVNASGPVMPGQAQAETVSEEFKFRQTPHSRGGSCGRPQSGLHWFLGIRSKLSRDGANAAGLLVHPSPRRLLARLELPRNGNFGYDPYTDMAT